MKERTQHALDSFCRQCPDVKMIKAYEHQPNDDRRLMELTYYAYLDGESIEVQSFKTSGMMNNDLGIREADLQEWADSAKQEFDRLKSAIYLLDSLHLLVR